MMICPRCGAENRDDVRFCRHCGLRLIQNHSAPTASSAVPTNQSISVCEVCGAAVKPTSRFCPRCGNEIHAPKSGQISQQPIIAAHIPSTIASNQFAQPVPASHPAPSLSSHGYSQPMEVPPPSKTTSAKQVKTSNGSTKTKRKSQQSSTIWVWGAVVGIVLLIGILVVLTTIYIPKALKGTGLFTKNTPTAATEDVITETLTLTPSASPAIVLTTTPERTTETAPGYLIPAASIVLTTMPQTFTVGSQILVTVSLTNDSEDLIFPLRCDLVGSFTPVLTPSEGVTYSLTFTHTETALTPQATTFYVYSLDALTAGEVTIGADILIAVQTTDHRQVIIAPTIGIKVE